MTETASSTAPDSLRFAPPAFTISAELRWLLARAFGPPETRRPQALDAARLWRLATILDLGPRIGARSPHGALQREVGQELADDFLQERRKAVAVALIYEQLATQIAGMAAARSISLIFLKGFALHLMNLEPTGGRPFNDLDLLVPREQAETLHAELVASGFRAPDAPPSDQHLPPLSPPDGGSVDVHYRLAHLRIGDREGATAEELRNAGLLTDLERFAGSCAVPRGDLMAAHLLSHGMVQHAHRPNTYPLLRMVADLMDLLPDGAAWDRFRNGPYQWIHHRIHGRELEAVGRLCQRLAAGGLPDPDRESERDAEILLRHLLAGHLDEAYRRSLRIDYTQSRLRQARREGRLLGYLKEKIFVTDGHVELRHGKPASRWGYLGRKLWRPIDLAVRLVEAALGSLRVRARHARGAKDRADIE